MDSVQSVVDEAVAQQRTSDTVELQTPLSIAGDVVLSNVWQRLIAHREDIRQRVLQGARPDDATRP